jgi:hypothetical protein
MKFKKLIFYNFKYEAFYNKILITINTKIKYELFFILKIL